MPSTSYSEQFVAWVDIACGFSVLVEDEITETVASSWRSVRRMKDFCRDPTLGRAIQQLVDA